MIVTYVTFSVPDKCRLTFFQVVHEGDLIHRPRVICDSDPCRSSSSPLYATHTIHMQVSDLGKAMGKAGLRGSAQLPSLGQAVEAPPQHTVHRPEQPGGAQASRNRMKISVRTDRDEYYVIA
jgi:hypothetical protein